MKARIVTFAIGIIAILFSGCGPVVKTEMATRYYDYDDYILGGMPEKGLSLAIESSAGKPFQITLLLKNELERRQLINAYFVVDRNDFNSTPNIFLYLADNDSGERLPLKANKGAARGYSHEEAESSWFQLLDAKEYFRFTVDLEEFFTLDPRHSYRIQCEYNNTASGHTEKGTWVEKYAWVGSINSNTLILAAKTE